MRSKKYIVVAAESDKNILKAVHELGIEEYEHLHTMPVKKWAKRYGCLNIRLYVDFELNSLFSEHMKSAKLKGEYKNIQEFKDELTLFNANKANQLNNAKRRKIRLLEEEIEKVKSTF